MNDKQTAAQRLAILRDERDLRAMDVQIKERTIESAKSRLAALRGQAALDGVDLSERIAQISEQIAAAQELISSWPDVSAELDRRIADVQAEIQAEKSATLMAEYDQLVADEKARRVAWAQSLVTTAQRAFDVTQNTNRRKEIAAELATLGQNVAGAHVGFGRFPVTEVGTAKGVANAQRWLQHVENDTWQHASI